ncbi:MAG: hypothetical protein E7413_00615 [Ruminococcaceae bacterium]|nr:hypothetical protein [Oscillospiraceae bacterium]
MNNELKNFEGEQVLVSYWSPEFIEFFFGSSSIRLNNDTCIWRLKTNNKVIATSNDLMFSCEEAVSSVLLEEDALITDDFFDDVLKKCNSATENTVIKSIEGMNEDYTIVFSNGTSLEILSSQNGEATLFVK